MRGSWEVKRLDELCDIARGGSPRPIKEFLTNDVEGVNWIKISDATASSKYIYETKQKIKPEGIRRSRLVHDGDFLLSNSMSFGRPYIMRTSGCIHDGWLVLGNISESLNHDYLYYFLGSPEAYQQFDDRASGSTVRNLNIDLVRSVQILVPPIEDQKRIVAILDEAFAGIDTAIVNTKKNIANARELFESYLSAVFTVQGKSWKSKKFSECLRLKSGDGLTSKQMIPGEFSVFGGNGIAGNHNESNLSGDNVVIGRVGALCGNVRNITENIWLTDNAFKVTQTEQCMDNKFLTYLLNFKNLRKYARQSAQPVISNSSLKDIELNFPESVAEQKSINKKFDELHVEVERLKSIYQQKLNSLKELKQSLLQKAFSGELTAEADKHMDEAVA